MGKAAPKPPAAPDPYQTAEAQYTFNKQAFENVLRQGSLGTEGPGGSVTYTRNAEGLPTSQTTSLSPGLQGLYDTALGAAGSQFGMMPTGAFNPDVDASGLRDAYVRAGLSNVEDLWGRQDNERNVTYSERGIPMGSELYTNAEREVGEGRNKYLRDISDASWQAGANEEQRQFGNELTRYNLPFTTGANYLNAANAIPASLQGLPPAIQNLQPGNYAETANRNYASEVALYNQQAANQAAGLGSFLRFGGSVLGAPGVLPGIGSFLTGSDERIKEDIAPVGELDDGQTVYRYRYKGDPRVQIGLMAQEVEETHPEAVAEIGGIKFVDYDAATAPSMGAMLRSGMAA